MVAAVTGHLVDVGRQRVLVCSRKRSWLRLVLLRPGRRGGTCVPGMQVLRGVGMRCVTLLPWRPPQ